MTPRKSIHQEIWDTLPWYVNGTLGSAELDAVTNHLPTCEACREEVARCRGLAMAVRTAADPDWVPSPERLARLLGRIDEIEAAGAASLGRGRLRTWLAGVRETLWTTPVSVRWALAAQGALVVLLAALVTWQAGLPPGGQYRTLAGSADGPRRGQAQIRVVFTDDITEGEIRALLGTIHGAIAGGPSPMGAYTVEVPASGPDRTGAALHVLRANAKVRLAEPVGSR